MGRRPGAPILWLRALLATLEGKTRTRGEPMSDDEPASGAIVVHLFGPPPAVDGAPAKAPRTGFCYPHRPLVDDAARTVSCTLCKAPLDPIDVLLQVARRYDDWVRIAEETRTMRRDLEALRAEEKRVKARTRLHARKDAVEAVAAERERLAEIASRTDDIRRAAKRIDQLMGRREREASR
jgi:hypothetical protein